MDFFYKTRLYLNLLRYRGLRKKKHYSRWGEDLFLIKYFKNVNKGRYIDIGAFHPFRGSNTYLLHQKGWKGINIDINKISIDLFDIARPKDVNLNLAVSDEEKKIEIFQDKELGKMNTINPKFASFFLKKYNTNNIKSYKLNNILKKYSFNQTEFELMDIDSEGSEYSILKNFNFKKYKFKIILIEVILSFQLGEV